MSKLTKKEKIIQEKLDPNLSYSVDEAMEILQSVKSEKFDESVDISVKLGVDPNKSDQNVRGAVTCLLYTSPSPRDISGSRMPSSA